jgi:hypothetical protein
MRVTGKFIPPVYVPTPTPPPQNLTTKRQPLAGQHRGDPKEKPQSAGREAEGIVKRMLGRIKPHVVIRFLEEFCLTSKKVLRRMALLPVNAN